MDLGLAGKTVIVTGGASNIGRGITLAFAKEKANIVLVDLDEAQAQRVAKTAEGLGGKVLVLKTDVTDIGAVEAMVKKTVDTFGKVDVLVNNVGWDELQMFMETTPEFWDQVITRNYKTFLSCTKTVLPLMVEQKSGSIVSIGSDAGRIGEYRESIYGGMKAAIVSTSKSIAREVGRYGIRINVV